MTPDCRDPVGSAGSADEIILALSCAQAAEMRALDPLRIWGSPGRAWGSSGGALGMMTDDEYRGLVMIDDE